MSEKSVAAQPAMSRKNDADLQQRRPKRDENQTAANWALVFKCPKCGSILGAGVDFAIPPLPGPIRRHCLECGASFTPKQFKKYQK